jgi:hypothetical protein
MILSQQVVHVVTAMSGEQVDDEVVVEVAVRRPRDQSPSQVVLYAASTSRLRESRSADGWRR